jgi:hypothetical protein
MNGSRLRPYLLPVVAALIVVLGVALGSAPAVAMDGPTCGTLTPTMVGSARGETIVGTAGADVIVALGGDDTVRGLGGADILCAGAGRDRVEGGAGRDLVYGGNAPDLLLGGRGRDTLYGNAGDDELDGGADRDRCFAGPHGASREECENPFAAPPPTPAPTPTPSPPPTFQSTCVSLGGIFVPGPVVRQAIPYQYICDWAGISAWAYFRALDALDPLCDTGFPGSQWFLTEDPDYWGCVQP